MSTTNASSSFAPSGPPTSTTSPLPTTPNCTNGIVGSGCAPPADGGATSSRTLWIVALVCSCVTILILSVVLHFSTKRIRRHRRELRRAELAMLSAEQQRLEDVMESLLAEDNARRRNRRSPKSMGRHGVPVTSFTQEQGGRMEDIDDGNVYTAKKSSARHGTTRSSNQAHDHVATTEEDLVGNHLAHQGRGSMDMAYRPNLVDEEEELQAVFSPRDGDADIAKHCHHDHPSGARTHRIPTAANIAPMCLQDDDDDLE